MKSRLEVHDGEGDQSETSQDDESADVGKSLHEILNAWGPGKAVAKEEKSPEKAQVKQVHLTLLGSVGTRGLLGRRESEEQGSEK